MSNFEESPPYQNWYTMTSDQKYAFADPFNDRAISNPGEVPAWLLQDEVLATGVTFLKNQGPRIMVTVGLSPQETSDDLGDMAFGEYEGQVDSADMYGFEAFGHDPATFAEWRAGAAVNQATQNAEKFNDPDARLAAFQMECERLGYGWMVRDGYLARVAMATALSIRNKPDKPVSSYDVQGNGSQTQRPIERYMVATQRAIDMAPALSDPEKSRLLSERSPVQMSLLYHRKWLCAARVGLEASQRMRSLDLKELNVFLTAGQHAGYLATIFSLLGNQSIAMEIGEFDPTYNLNVQGMMDRVKIILSEVMVIDELLDQKATRFIR